MEIVIIGGDLRNYYLKDLIGENSFRIGFSNLDNSQLDDELINTKIRNANIIVSSIPLSKDYSTVFAPFSKQNIFIDDLIKNVKPGASLITGLADDRVIDVCESKSIKLIDILDDEIFQVKNARITAECCLNIIMNSSIKNIFDNNFLILGYGRISRILTRMLRILGADVTVAARNINKLIWAEVDEISYIELNKICNKTKSFDYIINTIPVVLFKDNYLRNVSPDTVLIELASKPGGFDKNQVNQYGIKLINGAGLPGKNAPLTAAKAIYEYLNRQLK